MEKKDIFSYEETIQQIETLLNELDNKELPLESAVDKYKKGLVFVKNCNDALDKVEKELTVIEETNKI